MSQVGCDSALLLTPSGASVNNTGGLSGNSTGSAPYGTMTVNGGLPSGTGLGGAYGSGGGGEGTAVSVSVVYGTSTQVLNGSTVYATYPASTITLVSSSKPCDSGSSTRVFWNHRNR